MKPLFILSNSSTTVRGVYFKVTNLTNITTSKVSNTTEFSEGKTVSVNNMANVSGAGFVSVKNTSNSFGNKSKTDIGIKASASYSPTTSTNIFYNPLAGSSVTQTFKFGSNLDKH